MKSGRILIFCTSSKVNILTPLSFKERQPFSYKRMDNCYQFFAIAPWHCGGGHLLDGYTIINIPMNYHTQSSCLY